MNKQKFWQLVLILIMISESLAIVTLLLDKFQQTKREDLIAECSQKTSTSIARIGKESIIELYTKRIDFLTQMASESLQNNYVIKISPDEIDMLVQLVQHEVGTSASYYPGYDFDYIQQCMAKLVVNRAQRSNLSIKAVIQQKGQFENWKRMFRFSKDHTVTRKNVEMVLSGQDNISPNLLFQMSFKKRTLKQSLNRMQKKVGKIKPYHHVISADKRLMIFAVAHN